MGRGPDIRINIYPIGAIVCTFSSVFTQAGINQTNHKIYVNVTSSINVVLPIHNKRIESTTQILICESVIIGKVPHFYLDGGGMGNLLNLNP
jgi:sporulation protein YunB